MKPIVRNIHNDELYRYNGENNFTNIRTGESGIVSDEKASKVFKFNIEATQLISEYPIIEKVIKSLNLKFDTNDKES